MATTPQEDSSINLRHKAEPKNGIRNRLRRSRLLFLLYRHFGPQPKMRVLGLLRQTRSRFAPLNFTANDIHPRFGTCHR